jgi:hypothetical protein
VTIAYRRPPNLGDKIIRVKLTNNIPRNLSQVSGKVINDCTHPANKICPYCPKMDITGTIRSMITTRSCKAPSTVSCGSNNLIYLVTGKKCSKQYVGETKNILNKRLYYHFYDIKNMKNPQNAPPSAKTKTYGPMIKHFATQDHSLDNKIIP